ncbi:MAG: helix-turn-helix domain-containing protein [Planctomycetes bacterium]|nr:helix-turn-helix domain-containing protein [Planctomycetota bacterium]
MSLAAAQSKEYQSVYVKLIRKFPLRPIRSDAELDEAVARIDSLLDRGSLAPAAEDYLEVLSDLVERYESQTAPMKPLPDRAMLRFLIESKDVSQTQVAKETGIANSTISEVLKGKRRLSRTHVERLAEYFHVSPGVFSSKPHVN